MKWILTFMWGVFFVLVFSFIGLDIKAHEADAAQYREPTRREIVLAIQDLERQVKKLEARIRRLEYRR